jgi:NTP pyrophosphatase (non-canonical NTP hydrolase)
VNGHDLAREIIAKHGIDRYPEVPLVMMKLMEELGELSSALLEHKRHNGGMDWADTCPEVRKEYADVGLTLHALGNLLGLDLTFEMQRVVEQETRRFGA